MSLLRPCLGLLLVCWFACGPVASAEDSPSPLYVVSYVELLPAGRDDGPLLVRRYADDLRVGKDNPGVQVLQRVDRPQQFVVIETWKNKSAFDAERAAVGQLGDKLAGQLAAAVDQRLHAALATAPAGSGTADTFYVVTHVDVVPTRKDDGVTLLQRLSAESRKQDGNIRFDVLQQTARPNHFTVIEAWKSRGAFEAHTRATPTRAFRDDIQPAIGALYDDRFFRLLN